MATILGSVMCKCCAKADQGKNQKTERYHAAYAKTNSKWVCEREILSDKTAQTFFYF